MAEERKEAKVFRAAAETMVDISNYGCRWADSLTRFYNSLKITKRGINPWGDQRKKWNEASKKVEEIYDRWPEIVQKHYSYRFSGKLGHKTEELPYWFNSEDNEKILRGIKEHTQEPLGFSNDLIDVTIKFDDATSGRVCYNNSIPILPSVSIELEKEYETDPLEFLKRIKPDEISTKVSFEIDGKEKNIEFAKNQGNFLTSEIVSGESNLESKFSWNPNEFAPDGTRITKGGNLAMINGSLTSKDNMTKLNLEYTIFSDSESLRKEICIPKEEFDSLEQRINSIVSS